MEPFLRCPPCTRRGADVRDAAVCAAVATPDQTIEVKDGGLANALRVFAKSTERSVCRPGGSECDL